MNTDEARRLADGNDLAAEAWVPDSDAHKFRKDTATMLRAQADELDRLRAELSDAIGWRDAAQEELRKCQQDAIILQSELDALRKQEPVAWQCRFHISDSWTDCSREHHDLVVKRSPPEFQDYEARALYAAPKPGEQQ